MKSPVRFIHVKALGFNSQVKVCTKGQWDELLIALKTKDTHTLREWALNMAAGKLSEHAPASVYTAFCEQYKAEVDDIKEHFSDYYGAPYTPYDPENAGGEGGNTENIELPITTFAENLVYLYTGLNFLEIEGLNYFEYCMFLSDAMKMRIINNRGYEKGAEYLNECYRFAHKINSGF